tara:strand:+ start:184 stop:1113 length:930 start_codon:yes stop_codon:yes gene_type:complete
MSKKPILVLGGSGFIGSRLVYRLSSLGHKVIVPTRRLLRGKHLQVMPTVQIIESDILDDNDLERLISVSDIVINLVGILHTKQSLKEKKWSLEFDLIHVDLPRRILKISRKYGVKRYLHMCALGAHINGPSMYLRSKAAGENIIINSKDLNVTSFRPSVVFGEGDNFLNLFVKLQTFFPILALGGVNTKFQPVYVEDVVEAFVNSIVNTEHYGMVFELVGPKIYTLKELLKLSGEFAGSPRPVINLPYFLAWIQALILEYIPGGPLLSRDNLDSMKMDNIRSGNYPLLDNWNPKVLENVVINYLKKDKL